MFYVLLFLQFTNAIVITTITVFCGDTEANVDILVSTLGQILYYADVREEQSIRIKQLYHSDSPLPGERLIS